MLGRGEGLAGGGRESGDAPPGAHAEPAGEAHCGRDSRDLLAQLTHLPTNERPPGPAGGPARDRSWASRRPLAATLAAFAALLASAAAANAQTEVWSATLTAEEQLSGTTVQYVGFNRVSGATLGSLDDNSFDLAGTPFTVKQLRIGLPSVVNSLALVLDTVPPAGLYPHLSLHLGSASLPLAEATVGTDGTGFGPATASPGATTRRSTCG